MKIFVGLISLIAVLLVAYDGIETAEQQRIGYPDLQTLRYDQTQPELVAASTQATENLG